MKNWRPRGDSLIFDHQWELEKLTRLEMVERVRYLLLLRERLGLDDLQNSKNDKNMSNMIARDVDSVIDDEDMLPSDDDEEEMDEIPDGEKITERQRLLMIKCMKLLMTDLAQQQQQSSNSIITPITPISNADENSNMSISQYSINSASTPSLTDISNDWHSQPKQQLVEKVNHNEHIQYFIPDLEEVAMSSMVTRKGYLNVLEHGCSGWKKRWIVVRRPYIFIYKSDKDSIERAVLNLTNAQVECSEDQMAMIKIPNTFR